MGAIHLKEVHPKDPPSDERHPLDAQRIDTKNCASCDVVRLASAEATSKSGGPVNGTMDVELLSCKEESSKKLTVNKKEGSMQLSMTRKGKITNKNK